MTHNRKGSFNVSNNRIDQKYLMIETGASMQKAVFLPKKETSTVTPCGWMWLVSLAVLSLGCTDSGQPPVLSRQIGAAGSVQEGAASGATAGVGRFAGLSADITPIEPPRVLEAVFVGDVMFGRYEEEGLEPNPPFVTEAFQYVAPLIAGADAAVANLETPLLRDPFLTCPWPPRLRFVGTPAATEALAAAGFHGVNVANNHVFDMRNLGVRDTLSLLAEHRLFAVGAPVEKGEMPFVPVPFSAAGQTVAFIGVTTARNSVDGPTVPELPYTPEDANVPDLLAPVIEEARRTYDHVIVFAHWGIPDERAPTPERRDAARALIDLGADAVIGHHPHVLQGIEIYNNGLIVYSLGDFLFDAMMDQRRLTGVLRVGFAPKSPCLDHVTFHPVAAMRAKGGGIVPRPAPGPLRRLAVQRLVDLSGEMGTRWEDDGNALHLVLPETCRQ